MKSMRPQTNFRVPRSSTRNSLSCLVQSVTGLFALKEAGNWKVTCEGIHLLVLAVESFLKTREPCNGTRACMQEKMQ